MNQEVKSGKVLSPSTPWTQRPVPGIEVADEQQTLKATLLSRLLSALNVML